MLEEAKEFGEPTYQEGELLDFKYFALTCKLVTKYTLIQTREKYIEHVQARREALKDEKAGQVKHFKMIKDFATHKHQVKKAIMVALYVALKVPFDSYAKTYKFIMGQPKARKLFSHHIQMVENSQPLTTGKPMTREEILDAVMLLEKLNLVNYKRALSLAEKEKPLSAIYKALKHCKALTEDVLFNKMGFEVADVIQNLQE